MTRQELVKIINDHEGDYGITSDECANRILAALESERVGEVVVAKGQFSTTDDWELFVSPRDGTTCNCEFTRLDGKSGQLIFRSEKEEA